MECTDKTQSDKKQRCDSSTTDREPCNRSRRAAVPAIGAAVGVILLPSSWRRPLINSVLLPAHAQTTSMPVEPQWVLTGLTTALGVPSGETEPVETYSRLRLSGCGLLPGTTLTINVIAEITPSGEISLITAASLTTAGGSFDEFINVDAGVIAVTSIVDAFLFEIDVDGEVFDYTANAAAIGAAAAGTAAPANC